MDIRAALESLSRFRVGVIGDIILDRYLLGETERISPEAPVPVVRATDQRDGPGGAANVAANLVAAGAEAFLFGVVGDDAEGEGLIALVEKAGIRAHILIDPGRPTTLKTRVIARNQQVLRVDRETCFGIAETLAGGLAEEVAGTELDALIIEDYDKGTLTPWLTEKLKKTMAGRLVSVDPKTAPIEQYAGVGLFKPNRREFLSEVRTGDDPVSIARAAVSMRKAMRVERLLVTLGGEGAIACDDGGAFHVPALRREVYDVTGAGDTVIAYVTLGLLAGLPFTEAACLASIAGGIKVGKFGAAPVSRDEVLAVADGEWNNLVAKTRKLK